MEEPDVVPAARGAIGLPRLGSSPQTALAQFVIRTLLRSRRHRAIVAFYLGGGFAIVALTWAGTIGAMGRPGATHLTATGLARRVNGPPLVSSVLIMCALWLGILTVFSLPLDLRANWLFRVTPTL